MWQMKQEFIEDTLKQLGVKKMNNVATTGASTG
jgi:hypothetical protein